MKVRKKLSMNRLLIIIAFVLIAVIGSGLIVTLVKVNKTIDTKTLSATAYEIGSIDDTGKEDNENSTSIRSKKLYNADGLKIELDSDATVTYKIFFYAKDESYVSKLASGSSLSVPTNAEYFRIVITPNNGGTLNYFDIATYAKQVTVTVNK